MDSWRDFVNVSLASGQPLDKIRQPSFRFMALRMTAPSTTVPCSSRGEGIGGSWQQNGEAKLGAEEVRAMWLPVAEWCWWRNGLRRQPQDVLFWTEWETMENDPPLPC